MRKILLVCAALACMTVSPVPAQDAAVKKIIEMGQNDNQVMHQLDILTNRFGGRLIGSDAYENAAEWMVREVTKSCSIGLTSNGFAPANPTRMEIPVPLILSFTCVQSPLIILNQQ